MDIVLNWVGQGIIVGLAVTALLAVARDAPARARYMAALVGLIAVLLLPLATLLPQWTREVAGPVAATGDASALVALPSHWLTSDWLAVGIWSLWTAVTAARTLGGLWALGRARRSSQTFPPEIEERLPHWQAIRTTGRRARLVLSDAVRTAAVFGGRTPMIAVSPALVDTLCASDLDRVVAHEWAHVQWRDDHAQVAQAWIRVVAGWHPGVWWLDRHVHFEREVACDEHAVRLTGSPKAYASCLTTLADLAVHTVRALPVVGASAGSHLHRRVTRVLRWGSTAYRRTRLAAGCACVLPVAIATLVADVRMVASPSAAFIDSVEHASSAMALVQNRDSRALPSRLPASIEPRAVARRDVSIHEPARPREPRIAAFDLAAEDPPGEDAVGAAEAAEPREQGTASTSAVPLASGARWPLTDLRDSSAVVPAIPAEGRATRTETQTLWSAAATGGVAIGRGSQKAATSTAGFFARVGKTIAGSF